MSSSKAWGCWVESGGHRVLGGERGSHHYYLCCWCSNSPTCWPFSVPLLLSPASTSNSCPKPNPDSLTETAPCAGSRGPLVHHPGSLSLAALTSPTHSMSLLPRLASRLLPPAAATPSWNLQAGDGHFTNSLHGPLLVPGPGLFYFGGWCHLEFCFSFSGRDCGISFLVKLFKSLPELPLPRSGELCGEETLSPGQSEASKWLFSQTRLGTHFLLRMNFLLPGKIV